MIGLRSNISLFFQFDHIDIKRGKKTLNQYTQKEPIYAKRWVGNAPFSDGLNVAN